VGLKMQDPVRLSYLVGSGIVKRLRKEGANLKFKLCIQESSTQTNKENEQNRKLDNTS